MKNFKNAIRLVIIIALIAGVWVYKTRTGDSDANTNQTASTTGATNSGLGMTVSGEPTCANLVTGAELNKVFGVSNFAIQTNSGANCIWATGDIKNGIGSGVLALSLNVAKIGAAEIALGEGAVTKNGGTPISGVEHAYLLSKDSGVVMFNGDFMYSFGVSDLSYAKQVTALAKLIAGKN